VSVCVCVCVCVCVLTVRHVDSQSSVERRVLPRDTRANLAAKNSQPGCEDYPAHQSEPFTDSESN
jgi:hypothetical protein